MPDLSVADVDGDPRQERVAKSPYRVLYDGQCEICQGCVSCLKTLDLKNKTTCLPISAEVLACGDSRLRMDDCLRQLHVVTPGGAILAGWDAVACLARLFPSTWLVGAAGRRFPFRNAGRLLYGFVARNRYSLSKCRGGACRVAKPEAVRRQARLGAFWSCYRFGFFIRSPLVLWAGIKAAAQRASIFARTYHERLELLDGKLTVLFLNGMLPNAVPLLFGELFTTVLYDGVAIDPGSPKMRRSLARHLRRIRPKIAKVIATHAHEGHVGNLNWLSGIHVDSVLRHLCQPQVADVVEGASENRPAGLALRRLPCGLAGNGCGGFLGWEPAGSPASANDLGVGDV
jgi:predicted DCC family thiol-disulfide oxidoreductase YuxK